MNRARSSATDADDESAVRDHAEPSAERSAEPSEGRRRQSRVPRIGNLIPGTTVCLVIAVVATLIGSQLSLLGSAVSGLLLGMALQAVRPVGPRFKPGVRFSSKYVLQASIVMLGLGLGIGRLFDTGVTTFPVMLGSLLAALLAAYVLGRMLGVDGELRTLIGAGTAICGGSAIAATGAAISASELAMAYSISTIFVYNALAVVVFPLAGHLMSMSQAGFGIWAGTAINDTSSVVAAAYGYGDVAGPTAVIVKLARTTMIIPMTLALSLIHLRRVSRDSPAGGRPSWKKIVPWFVVWFCVAVGVNSLGLIPSSVSDSSGTAAKFLITVALAGVGLSANFREMRRTGYRPLLLGGLLWMVVALSSLVLQAAFGLS